MQRRHKTFAGSEARAMRSMGVRRVDRRWFLVGPAIALIAFLVFVAARLFTQDLELSPVKTWEFPEFSDVSSMISIENGEWAVAVNGEVVSGSNLESPVVRPTASTAKMILGLAIMKEKPFPTTSLGETITISEEDFERYNWYVENGGSNVPVEVGEEIYQYDALVAVFLPSANNMADTLAIWAFGSLDNYREYATKMLEDYGITDTTIGVDASGFDESTTSTAADLARIGDLVLKNPVLAKIVGLKSAEIPVAGEIENTNQLLGEKGIVGIKTGYIGEPSGYCLVSGYKTEGANITVTVLGADSREESFDTTLAIVEKAQELLAAKEIIMSGEEVGYYDSWWTGRVPILSRQRLSVVGWSDAEKKSEIEVGETKLKFHLSIGESEYTIELTTKEYEKTPSVWERIMHVFGWENTAGKEAMVPDTEDDDEPEEENAEETPEKPIEELIEGPGGEASEEVSEDASECDTEDSNCEGNDV